VGVGVAVAVGGGVAVDEVVAVGSVVATSAMPTGGADGVALGVTSAMLATGAGGLLQATAANNTTTSPKCVSFMVHSSL
jgi:hypothetical protein